MIKLFLVSNEVRHRVPGINDHSVLMQSWFFQEWIREMGHDSFVVINSGLLACNSPLM